MRKIYCMTDFIEIEKKLINVDFINYVAVQDAIVQGKIETQKCVSLYLKNGDVVVSEDLETYKKIKALITWI